MVWVGPDRRVVRDVMDGHSEDGASGEAGAVGEGERAEDFAIEAYWGSLVCGRPIAEP